LIDTLHAELNKAIKSPAFTGKTEPAGVEPKGGTPEEFAEQLRRETTKWAAVTKAGIRAE
jgi:tripartite-type tricarboxylate transporter receptor subunit TctC